MRLKGISWIEQHFEKVFAAIAGVAAVGALIWQFVGPPNKVTVGKNNVPVEQAFSEVAQAARITKSAIERPQDPPVLPPNANPVAKFDQQYKAPVSPKPELVVSLGAKPQLPTTKGDVAAQTIAGLAPLKIAPPATPIALPGIITVSPIEARDPEVAKVLPPAAPYDKAYVTAESTFDGKALRKRFEEDPDGAGPLRSLNPLWWQNTQLLAVELHRQELGADGQWGKEARVMVMPGRFSLLPVIDQGIQGADLAAVKEQARDRFVEVRRPAFYRELIGEKWMAPTDRIAKEEKERNAGADAEPKLRRELSELEKKKTSLENILSKLPPALGPEANKPKGPAERDPDPTPPGGGGGGKRGGGPPGGGGGGGGNAPPPSNQPSKENDAKRREIERKIADTQRQINSIRNKLGMPVDNPGQAPTPPPPVTEASKVEPLLDTDRIRIWAHDVTVERGKSYRYRMVLVFDNPMFGKESVMIPAQAAWAKDPIVRSEPSDWSDRVDTDKETYYFVTSATEPGGPRNRGADASAELFTFTMGYWRKGVVTIEPGDRFAADISLPDFSKLPAMPAVPGPGNPPGAPDVPSPAERDPGGGGGGGKRGVPSRPEAPPEAPAPGNAPPAPQLPMVTKPIAADAILLGVEKGALVRDEGGHQVETVQAFVRRGDGAIEVRIPDDEKNSTVYNRVSRSANDAKLASMPKQPEQVPDTGERRPPGMPPPPPPPGGGGGGPGGSGG